MSEIIFDKDEDWENEYYAVMKHALEQSVRMENVRNAAKLTKAGYLQETVRAMDKR